MADSPLTDAELDALESLEKGASPAPWIAEYGPAIGGPDFIMITNWDDARPDMYVQHDDRPAPVADLQFIAAHAIRYPASSLGCVGIGEADQPRRDGPLSL